MRVLRNCTRAKLKSIQRSSFKIDVHFKEQPLEKKPYLRFFKKCLFHEGFCIFSTGASIKYVRNIFQRTNISNPLIRTRTSKYQGVRNVTFSGNLAYLMDGP